jgi:hypothetical protein
MKQTRSIQTNISKCFITYSLVGLLKKSSASHKEKFKQCKMIVVKEDDLLFFAKTSHQRTLHTHSTNSGDERRRKLSNQDSSSS